MSEFVSDASQMEVLDAIAAGEGYYLSCPNEHGSLPPQHCCPECQSAELTETPLPETGTLVTYTVTHVAGTQFDADAPYIVAIADFGSVRLTGQIRGYDPDAVEIGMPVEVTVANSRTADSLVAFSPLE